MRRRFYLFTVMTALFLLSAPKLWADEVASGMLGPSVFWNLDDQGALNVWGEGIMNINLQGEFSDYTIKSVVIGDGVTTIGGSAFTDQTELSSVTIASSVTLIESYAFSGCYGLEKIECKAVNPPSCGYQALGINNKKCVVYVPENSVAAYKAAEGWKDLMSDGKSGDCGENLKWTLSDDSVLTISGEGAMEELSNYPWEKLTFTKVVIGQGVTTIAKGAFYKNSDLTSVEISNTVTSIGQGSFYECSGLTSVTIPGSVTSIGKNAFNGCNGLTSLTIPSSVTSIGEYAFVSCTGLESITVAADNSTYDSRDNCNAIIETATNTLIMGCKNSSIPNTVTTIRECAFAYCSELTSVTIPSSVTSIEEDAFGACTGLKKVECQAETPPSCESYAFEDVDMDSCVLYVPKNSIEAYKTHKRWGEFTNIEALTGGTVSGSCGENLKWTLDANGVLTISGTGAMTDYTPQTGVWKDLSVTGVVIEEGVTTIGNYAFYNLTGLTSVTIPNSVTSIGWDAFEKCSGLTSVTIPNSVTSIAKYAFYKCSGLESATIGNSVTTIGEFAFCDCRGLTSVTIGSSVTSIAKYAFYNSGLKTIESLAVTPPTCGNNVFDKVDTGNCELIVPNGSLDAYKEKDPWKGFGKIGTVVTGINSVAQESNVAIAASNGTISVTGAAAGTVVEVYSVNGTLVYRGTSTTVSVPTAGIYVVKAAGKTVKVNAAR